MPTPTTLQVGDRVRVTARPGPRRRDDGREGWVAQVAGRRFPSGTTLIEVGVAFSPARYGEGFYVDMWYHVDELEPVP